MSVIIVEGYSRYESTFQQRKKM